MNDHYDNVLHFCPTALVFLVTSLVMPQKVISIDRQSRSSSLNGLAMLSILGDIACDVENVVMNPRDGNLDD